MPLANKLSNGFEGEYVKESGLKCPACADPNIVSFDGVEVGVGFAYQDIECRTCHAVWRDLYKLVGFTDLSNPDVD